MRILDQALCAQCLRTIKDPRIPVFVRPADRAGFEVSPGNLAEVIHTYGTGRLECPADTMIMLFAVTLINGELRCAWHVER